MLDVASAEQPPTADDPAPLVLRAVANIMLGRMRRRRSRISPTRSSATSTTRRCGARWPMRGRANGPRRAKASAMSMPRSARCRSSCSGRCCKDMVRAVDRGRRHHRRGRPSSTNSRRSAFRPTRAGDVGADGPDRRGARPHRGRAARLSGRRRIRADRPAAAQGRLREIVLQHSLGDLKRDRTPSPRSRRSPRSGAATRPRSRRCNCWRGSTPRTAATATRSTSCAPRLRRIRTRR